MLSQGQVALTLAVVKAHQAAVSCLAAGIDRLHLVAFAGANCAQFCARN
jgi:electron transfer flavoprotein alpha/beta subunit